MELIQNKEGLEATLTVKIGQEDYASNVEKGLKKARQTAQIKGFRPGNTPMSLIKKLYGQPILIDEVNKLLVGLLEKYEKENTDLLLGNIIPSKEKQKLVDFETQKDFEFVYEAGFLPESTYQIDENTELTYYNILVDDNIVDKEINYIRDTYSKLESVENAEDHDQIKAVTTIIKEEDIKEEEEEEEKEEEKKETKEVEHNIYFLMSSIPDEYKSLFLGTKAGDEIKVEIRKVFTNEVDLCGMLELNKEGLELQPDVLTFTITDILRKAPAEINQDFFDLVTGKDVIHSEEELRKFISGKVAENYESFSIDKLYGDSIGIVLEKANILLPENFIAKFLRHMQKEDQEITDEQFNDSVKGFIQETRIKYLINLLLTREEFEITDDMVINEVKQVIRERVGNVFANAAMDSLVEHFLKDQQELQAILWRIRVNEVAKLLKERAKLNIIDVTIEEFRLLEEEFIADSLEENNPAIEEIPVTEEITTDDSEQINTENQEINKTEEE
jgi:trigger factor